MTVREVLRLLEKDGWFLVRPEVRQLIREAIELHVEALREGGEAVPPPSSSVEYVEIPTAA